MDSNLTVAELGCEALDSFFARVLKSYGSLPSVVRSPPKVRPEPVRPVRLERDGVSRSGSVCTS